MHNIYKHAAVEEEIDVIIHLAEQPVATQKRLAELNGIHCTDEIEKRIESAVNIQQQQVIAEMTAQNIQTKKVHTFKTVLNAISAVIKIKDLDKLRSIKDVLFIEPDLQVKAMGANSASEMAKAENEFDPVYSELKALWAEGIEGHGIKVAVLDSGIDKNHPDLKEVYRGGKNFIDQSNPEEYTRLRDEDDPSETSPDERPEGVPEKNPTSAARFETYHGTHIAGILAGKNKNGVKGVAPKIDLYAYRVFGAYTIGDTSNVLKGIEEAISQKIDVINLSLSDVSDSENHALSFAVNNAVLAGVVVVSTAGNTGSVRGSIRAPGTSRLGISVGNSNLADEVDSSSSRGPSRPNFDIKPDIVAPGTDIFSTMPRYSKNDSIMVYKDAYKRETGTSQAVPYIAGIVALIKQAHPDWTPMDIKVAISNTAKVLDTKTFNVFDQGAGRIQPYAAVHPSILAYSIEEVDANGEGQLVENRKGTITFGPVTLNEDISITKSILVKDVIGDGGNYDVSIHVTKAFKDAQITVDQPSFALNGECLLRVTLTASKNTDTKYRDEILGYMHIANQDQSVTISLPFAADFSNGATVTPAIEEFSITTTDLSYDNDVKDAEAIVKLSVNSDLSYPSLEIIDYLSKAPIDSLFYSNGLGLGARKFPILRKYISCWTQEEATLEDGIYSFDFVGMAKAESLTNSVGPIFIKSTKSVITGSIHASLVSGQVKDRYIDFNHALTELGERFDLNEKLHAFYTVTKNGQPNMPVSFLLSQDGTFSFELETFDAEKDIVTVFITDAAGNTSSSCIE